MSRYRPLSARSGLSHTSALTANIKCMAVSAKPGAIHSDIPENVDRTNAMFTHRVTSDVALGQKQNSLAHRNI